MRYKKAKLLSLFILCVALLAEGTPVSAVYTQEKTAKFVDVSSSHWAYNAISDVIENGLFEAQSTSEFAPDNAVIGVDVISSLYRIAELTENNLIDPKNHVLGEPDYIVWAHSVALLDFFDDDFFSYNQPLTREAATILLFRYAELFVLPDLSEEGKTDPASILKMNDIQDASDYALDALRWAFSEGILKGTIDQEILPGKIITRAQYAAVLDRFYQYVLANNGDIQISIRFPSAKQSTIASGRDFYVIGDFLGSVGIPDDAFLDIQVRDVELKICRDVHTCIKNNTNLYLDYPGLQIFEGEEYFDECMMPDLVYDPEKPDSWMDTWNKACYSDFNYTATMFGGGYTKNVNMNDENGVAMAQLPDGKYILTVSLYESANKGNCLGATSMTIYIGTLKHKVLSRFWPQEHLDLVTKDAEKNNFVILYDPFPGYWLSSAVGLNTDKIFNANIPSKWQYMDGAEYADGTVELYIYNISDTCTSWVTELGRMAADNRVEFAECFYYDTGEPYLPNYDRVGEFQSFKGFAMAEFTRVDYPTGDSRDNYLRISDLENMRSAVLSDTNYIISASVGEVLSVYGLCRPLGDDNVEMNPDSTFDYDNRMNKVHLFAEYDGKTVDLGVHDVILEREYSDANVSRSVLEFKTDIKIGDQMRGKTVILSAEFSTLEGEETYPANHDITIQVAS